VNINKTKYALISKHENLFLYLGVIFTAFVFFLLIKGIVLATHDDIVNYLSIRNMSISSYLKMSFMTSKNIGRIFQTASIFLCYIAYKPNNIILYKIIFYVYICFSVISLWHLIYNHIDKKISILAVLFFFAFAQIDHQHNLFISYPGMQIFIGLAILSIERLLAYYKERRISTLLWSSIFLFVSTIMYETFIIYSIILFIISVYYTLRDNKNIKKIKCVIYSLYDLRFHIILMILYLLIYAFGRLSASSSYSGAVVKIDNIKDPLNVLVKYSLGLFPLNCFLHLPKYNILSYVKHIDLLSITKAIIVVVIFIAVVCKARIIRIKNFCLFCSISVFGMILPNILLSFTPQKINFVKNGGGYGFTTSFYSYFAIIIFLSTVFVFIYQRINFKKTILGILSIGIFFGSIFTDITNKMSADSFSIELNKYKIFDKTVSSEYFKNIENGSVIYAPEFIGIHYNMSALNMVTHIYSPDKIFIFTNNINDLKYDRPTYLLRYYSNSNTIFIAPIDNNNMFSDEMMIISLFSLETKNLILEREQSGIVSIGDYNNFYETNIIPLNNIHDDSVLVHGEKIDVLRSEIIQLNMISNIKKYNAQNLFDNMLLSGWSFLEPWGVWSNGSTALLGFTVKEKENMLINLKFNLYPNPTNFSVSINEKQIDSYSISGSKELSIKIDKDLLVEVEGVYPVIIKFNIENPAMPEGDNRMLGIGLTGFYISSVISDINRIFQASNSFGGKLLSGWSGIEQWGVWSEGNTAQLRFSLQEKKEILLKLNFNVFPSPTNFSININGIKIGEYTFESAFKDEGVYQIAIPVQIDYLEEKDGVFPIIVQFDIKNPAMPEGDPRMLGIGLTSFYFSPIK